MIDIPKVNRDLARITYMSIDKDGRLVIGEPELRLLAPLLFQNLHLVRRFDELQGLSHIALAAGDLEWTNEICAQMERLGGGE